VTEIPWDDEAAVLALLNAQAEGVLLEKMGIRLTAVAPGRVVGTMPVDGNRQPYGLLHGGASCVLAESLASLGSALHGWPDKVAVGVDINATHHRSATDGLVTGVASALQLGGTVASWEVVVTDEQDRRICTSRVTCLLRPARPPADSPSAGSD
jgi:1,4-dihydroxy-2-naphthoyl-CoA hydrolase